MTGFTSRLAVPAWVSTRLRRPYTGCTTARLWPRLLLPCAGALSLGLSVGGCSLSSQMDSFFSSDKSDVTGSITPPPGAAASDLPANADLTYARAAASELLRRGKKDASLDWVDPRTGARGTVTPIAAAYVQDGRECRDFLASYVAGTAQAWLQGDACKASQGTWEVRSLKPWKRS